MIHWSPEFCRIFGEPEGTVITVAQLFERVPASEREGLRRAKREGIERGVPFEIEHRVERPDGRLCWVHARATIEPGAGGEASQLAVVVQDVTEWRAVLDSLRASEARYRRIIDNTSEGVWLSDANYVTTFVNKRMADMLGSTVEEMIGQPAFSFVAAEGLAKARVMTERRRKTHRETYSNVYRKKDGTSIWALVKTNAIFSESGEFEGTLALLSDITEQRKIEEARKQLAAIVESSDDAIVGVTMGGLITSWNLSAQRLYQYSADEAVGRSILIIVPPSRREEEQSILERVGRGELVAPYETQRVRKDGSVIEVAVTISPIRDTSGTIIGASKITRDLTPRKLAEAALHRTEEQFRQAQKMEAVGRLAGGVAHDFNNMLSVILSYADFAISDLKAGDPMRDDMEQIQTAARRAAELTGQLLAFSRQQVLQPRVIDLNQIVAGMQRMLGRLLGEDIELSLRPSIELGRVLADPGQIEQVVMNLAVNARDAMPHGGKLTIETSNVELDASYARTCVGVGPGAYVMLAVSDTGTGMDAATQARIFEPFFTTKAKGKGTGLGLSTVFGIVQQSGGRVGVYSELGQGTSFKVYLARTDRAAGAELAVEAPVLLRGSETILLVEDEPQVRAVACAILRRSGYQVMEAANGGEAFLLSKNFSGEIHLLLTDVVMPLMSGRKLSEELAPLRPDMKILFASGYTDDAIVHHGVLEEGVAFIQKPFTPDTLLRKVRDVLAAGAPRGR